MQEHLVKYKPIKIQFRGLKLLLFGALGIIFGPILEALGIVGGPPPEGINAEVIFTLTMTFSYCLGLIFILFGLIKESPKNLGISAGIAALLFIFVSILVHPLQTGILQHIRDFLANISLWFLVFLYLSMKYNFGKKFLRVFTGIKD